jgi:hypothetical protein
MAALVAVSGADEFGARARRAIILPCIVAPTVCSLGFCVRATAPAGRVAQTMNSVSIASLSFAAPQSFVVIIVV